MTTSSRSTASDWEYLGSHNQGLGFKYVISAWRYHPKSHFFYFLWWYDRNNAYELCIARQMTHRETIAWWDTHNLNPATTIDWRQSEMAYLIPGNSGRRFEILARSRGQDLTAERWESLKHNPTAFFVEQIL